MNKSELKDLDKLTDEGLIRFKKYLNKAKRRAFSPNQAEYLSVLEEHIEAKLKLRAAKRKVDNNIWLKVFK